MARGFSTLILGLLDALRLPRMAVLVEFEDLGLRLTNWPRNITLDGKTYFGSATRANRFTLGVEGLSENLKFEAPSSVLNIGSLDTWAQQLFLDDSFRGDRVTITLIYSTAANTFISTGWVSTFAADAEECDADKVSIRLGSLDSVSGTEVPRRTTHENGCQSDFQVHDDVGGCPFVFVPGVHAPALSVCDHSYDGPNGCIPHFPNVTDPVTGQSVAQTKPYSAFVGSLDHRLVQRGG